MELVIVPADRVIVVDHYPIQFPGDLDIASTFAAVQWDGESGRIEYNDGQVEALTGITQFSALITQHSEAKAAIEAAQAAWENSWDYIRELRAPLLKDSDWAVLADSPLSEAKKAEWITYRQALRDITEVYENPADVVWPTPPD